MKIKSEKPIVDFVTLGCSKNLVDSELLMRQFDALGYSVHHDSSNPKGQIAIINTCGFIGDAKEESIQTILQFAQNKKNGKLDKLYVMGCLSERYREELEKEIPEVDKFFGKFDYSNILADLGATFRVDLRNERTLTTPEHYAYIKISEGCNRMCSFCAIPLITGRHKSRKTEDIIQEVKLLVDKGVKEFQLIAQDLSSYGIDIYKTHKLADLVEQISDIEGVDWIRLHYAYPSDFPNEILHVIRERPNVCNYLDLALQHISDNMLGMMRRQISKKQTLELIHRIRTEVPNIHLRTTLMVGHPGETENDFQELKSFVTEQRFERMGAFAYSNEDGTYAHKHYQDIISNEIKQQRLEELMSIQEKISFELNQNKIGKTMKVLVDRQDNGYFVGRTEYDSPEVDQEVLIDKSDCNLSIGQFYHIKITNATEFDLFGKMIQ